MSQVRRRIPVRKVLLVVLVVALVSVLVVVVYGGLGQPSESISYTIADSTGAWGYPSPYAHYSRGPGYVRMSFIFETLVWKDDSGFVPALATDWEYLEEENAYIFQLRDDVTWHDGTSFTAEDVVFTFNYTKQHPYQWVDSSLVESAEAIDEYTVKLYLSQLYAPFLQDVVGTQPITPKHIWQNVTDPEKFTDAQAVIGTGPYTLADYSQEHGSYLYRAYDDYYLGRPSVDEIKFIKIAAEMIPAALMDASVNAGDVPPEIVSAVEQRGLIIIGEPYGWNAKLMINHQEEPLDSKQFRQALAYAINRTELVEIARRGQALVGSPGMIPPTSIWYNPKTPQFEYNPAKTRQLLEGLNYTRENDYFTKDGQQLSLNLIAPADFQEDLEEVGQLIKKQLEAAGIKIDFSTLEAKTVDSRVAAWDFDIALYGHGGLYDPSILKKVILGQGFISARYTSNSTLNELINAQLGEMDFEKRKELVWQIQEIYAEEVPALTLYYPNWYWAHDGTVALFYTWDGIGMGIPIPLNRLAFVK
jgi:peptide/nickel transport system substrate-binding protein